MSDSMNTFIGKVLKPGDYQYRSNRLLEEKFIVCYQVVSATDEVHIIVYDVLVYEKGVGYFNANHAFPQNFEGTIIHFVEHFLTLQVRQYLGGIQIKFKTEWRPNKYSDG
jgi:hypothetical protein